jgi:phospholipid/cholesterol/gamma-HCH transport system ATP-binding protein
MDNAQDHACIEVRDLTMTYGDYVVQRDVSFTVQREDVFAIMGVSGCGKSTLMKHMIGLLEPASGRVLYNGTSYWEADREKQQTLRRSWGVSFQGGGLWSSLTLGENVALPLEQFTGIGPSEKRDLVNLKLALVGLAGFDDYYPAELSGGMQKRAALARAIALDPDILFFDEPSAGLDPVSARRLDDLILEMRDSLGATVVIVTHELASILAVGSDGVFLDPDSKTIVARGDPKELRESCDHPGVRAFLNRGEPD